MAEVQGTCDERFEGVRAALAGTLDSGADVGCCAAVAIDGELVADVWGGTVDEAGTAPWQRDTITNVWSTTKTMTFLCALMLADQGELRFEDPVERYWPEFKAGGKEAVEVRHLMAHTAGLSGWQEPMTARDLEDWEQATSLLAAQGPWWEPGSASGYHAITQGYLIGEVVRRITGSTIGTFFREHLAEPLGADFHIGLPAEHDDRVARVIPPALELDMAGIDPNGIAVRTLTNPMMAAEMAWTEGWRRAEIPAAGGHGNARSVAQVQSVMACRGEVAGRRFLSEAGCLRALEEQISGIDLVLGTPLRFGLGYGLPSEDMPISPSENACYWGGWGGSLVIVDLDAHMVVTYVMNKMQQGTVGDLRGAAVVMAAYAGLAESA